MKISYAVDNLRSIGDMSPVELRPLTILVGANNSGKSTFLRSFSLLKQSLEENTNEPILWFDPKSVDFDDFHTAVNRTNAVDEISFDFIFHDLELRRYAPQFVNLPPEFGGKDSFHKVNYKINIKSNENSTYISRLDIDIKDYDLSFTVLLNKEGMSLPELDNIRLPNIYLENIFFRNDRMFSSILMSSNVISPIIEHNSENSKIVQRYFDLFPFTNFIISEIRKRILEILNSECENFASSSENLLVIEEEARRIAFLHPFDEDKVRELCKHSKIDYISVLYNYLLEDKHQSTFKQFQQHCAMNLILLVQSKLNNKLQDIFKSCTRIGPVRDLNQRIFRIQSLNVSNISINGDNLPMLLYSLKMNDELVKFSDWINKIIGYKIDVELEPGFIRIRIIDGDLNLDLVDTGQGLSEILPVLAQIWMVTVGSESIPAENQKRQRNGKTKLITLEQPELHLHPKHQANLADAFASALENFKLLDTKPIFIVETHSDVLINRLGALIENQVVSREDVQIVLFSKSSSKPNSTDISTSIFDEEGVLIDWPYGFFNY